MRVQLRIVAGSLRGRKLTCTVSRCLRPAPQMLREALFSILGGAVPGRAFFDLFAGTGAIGLEALSRGAKPVTLIERDFRVAAEIEEHLHRFGIAGQAAVLRADVYRWAERWPGASEPVNIFVGPPYADFERRQSDLFLLIADLQQKLAPGSILALQSERRDMRQQLPAPDEWDERTYGRNKLLIWVKPS